mmetsp:Transcript_71942/g.203925  ORF Transcript_71942/g.203925 Transcript_71942/m.203925 type:complete len:343 (+) Transcript_71942:4310-5338(+)
MLVSPITNPLPKPPRQRRHIVRVDVVAVVVAVEAAASKAAALHRLGGVLARGHHILPIDPVQPILVLRGQRADLALGDSEAEGVDGVLEVGIGDDAADLSLLPLLERAAVRAADGLDHPQAGADLPLHEVNVGTCSGPLRKALVVDERTPAVEVEALTDGRHVHRADGEAEPVDAGPLELDVGYLARLVRVLAAERVGNVAPRLAPAVPLLAELGGDALVHGAELVARPLRFVHDHIHKDLVIHRAIVVQVEAQGEVLEVVLRQLELHPAQNLLERTRGHLPVLVLVLLLEQRAQLPPLALVLLPVPLVHDVPGVARDEGVVVLEFGLGAQVAAARRQPNEA